MFLNQSKETHPSNTSGRREEQELFPKDPFSLLVCLYWPAVNICMLVFQVQAESWVIHNPCLPLMGIGFVSRIILFYGLGISFGWNFFVQLLHFFSAFPPSKFVHFSATPVPPGKRGSVSILLPPPKMTWVKIETGFVAEYYQPQSKMTRTQQLSLSQSNTSEQGAIWPHFLLLAASTSTFHQLPPATGSNLNTQPYQPNQRPAEDQTACSSSNRPWHFAVSHQSFAWITNKWMEP